MTPGAFATAVRARGFRMIGDRIIGQTGGWWKVVTDAQGRIDRARSLRKACKGDGRKSPSATRDLMGVDRATTGPKFIRALEADGLVSIESHPEIDKRKDFLAPTKKLERLVEGELVSGIAPVGTLSVSTYRQRATTSLRASAMIMMRRTGPDP
jgi:hypothetical protein